MLRVHPNLGACLFVGGEGGSFGYAALRSGCVFPAKIMRGERPPFTPHTPPISLPQMAVGEPLHESLTSAIRAWSMTSSLGATGSNKRCHGLGIAVLQARTAEETRLGPVPSTAAFRGEGFRGSVP